MNTLEQISKRFKVDLSIKSPIIITNINRTIMAGVLAELGYKEGAEIGVAEGYHAKVLCENNPGVKLYCVDIWEKYPGYEEYANIEEVYLAAKARLKSYNCEFIKKFSMDAVKDFADGSLDFVYLDSAHDLKSVSDDINEWSKKVRVGGIVFGHDYKHHRSYMDKGKFRYPVYVKDAINSFCQTKNINPWFILTNDIKDPTFGPDSPGWCFVRQETDLI